MRIIITSFIALAFLASCEQKMDKPVSGPETEKIPVTLLPISGDTANRVINVSGTLNTEQSANLSFKIGGIIENISVREGDRVKKGQLLAFLKGAEISAQVSQAKLALEKAQRDFERARNLYADSVVTLEELQNAKTGLDIAKQYFQQVVFNEQYSRIYAPSDGFITVKKLNAGEMAAPGITVITMNVSSPESKWVLNAGLSDAEWSVIEIGNTAKVRFDAFPESRFDAVVSKKSLSAEPVNGSFPVELQIKFQSEKPAAGMFGTAAIEVSGTSVGITVPYDALLEASGKKGFVFVSDDKRTVKRVEITILSVNHNRVTVSDGLKGHKFIVVSGSPYLNDSSLITTL